MSVENLEINMQPTISYTIWFTQRTGSSLLCSALESTGIAGVPGEWLYKQDLFESYAADSPAELQQALWKNASTPNGVLGIKHSFYEPAFDDLIEFFKRFPTCPADATRRVAIWEAVFPNHRHIFMTRRNKVRLAVSWWKAIQSNEWHRRTGEKAKGVDLSNAYSFDAIKHLFTEVSMREAGIQEFLAEGKIVPLTIVYEDFIQEYEGTVWKILDYLGLGRNGVSISTPYFTPTADDLSEEWAQRFRHELQAGWRNRGW
jgi:LPS sulfotransferase NodH